jgi:cytochrome b561
MVDLPNEEKAELYGMHKATGVVVLFFVSLRILWRLINIVPALPKTMPSWQALGYKIGITAMYLLMLSMPISGLLAGLYNGRDLSVYGLFTIYAFEKNEQISYLAWNLHGIGAWAFVIFITMHSLVALYHHFIDKDRLLLRMIKGE